LGGIGNTYSTAKKAVIRYHRKFARDDRQLLLFPQV